MNYPKHKLLTLLFLVFLPLSSQADLKAYTAVYQLHAAGFHIGETTQTLTKLDNLWSLQLVTQPQGLAWFFQSNPATEKQLFSYNNGEIEFVSLASDSGQNKEEEKYFAYYDKIEKQLITKTADKAISLSVKQPLSSLLLLPMSAKTFESNQPQELTIYDKGHIEKKIMAFKGRVSVEYQGIQISSKIIDVYSNNSEKRLRYYFSHHFSVPFRIEKIKNNEIKGYLELDSLH